MNEGEEVGKMQKTKFEDLEDVKFKIEKGAFKPKTLTCSKCHIKMKKSEIDINLMGNVSIGISGFECPKCKKRYLGLEEATKLDKAMIMSRFIRSDKKEFQMERSISFDGDNWTMRIPKEFTHEVHKKKVGILPLGAKQFCISIE